MTEKQKVFCEEYVRTYSAINAYRKAYPDAKEITIKTHYKDLLKKEDCIAYIKELQEAAVKAFGNAGDLIAKELLEDITYRDEDGKHNPGWQKSVDLLSKNLGLQKQDISVKQTTITVDIDE